MSTQNIMWTTLPNGLAPTGDKLRLSVLVSPRLTSSTGKLADFPDFLDWPATMAGLKFDVEFMAGPTVSATPVVEPGYPALDSTAWKALFPTDTLVTSYIFDDRSGLHVRSFPTKKVLSFLTNTYQTIAVQTPQRKPTLLQLGFGRGHGIVQLNQIAIYSDEQPGLEERINSELNSVDTSGRPLNAVPSTFGGPQTDFLQLRLTHQFLSQYKPYPKEERKKGGNSIPQPPQNLPDVDFHKGVASVGQYPKLMRALGIAIDLEVPLADVPASSNVRLHPSLSGLPPMTPWTAYTLDTVNKRFVAASVAGSDVTDGMLQFSGPDDYDVVELDVDGAGEKLLDFSYNLARLGFGAAPASIDTPTEYGLPSLRSAGFSAARVDRAVRLVNTFYAAKSNNQEITTDPKTSKFFLHAEDLTRGYRVDVWNSLSGQWHSLSLRDGTYHFLNGPLTRQYSDEGFVTIATTQSADGTTTDLRLPESLFRWAGWSLCAPRPGKTIGGAPKYEPTPPTNPATTSIKLETAFTVQKGTLPRLRFGAQYQFRARAVDLAGNSVPPDAVLADIYNLPPQPIPYLRYEPVAAPAVVLRHALGPVTTPGESGDRIVIRSNYNTHIAAVSERHIAPPKTTETMAETHGMLDTPAGPPDKAMYAMLVSKDGDFGTDPTVPHPPLPHPEAQLVLPYLPDPFAPGAAFSNLPGTAVGTITQVPFTLTTHSGIWPYTTPFRFVLDEGSGAPVFTENATERVLRVHLPKAEIVVVAMSCFLTDDPTTKPPKMLSTMKIWSLIEAANPSDLAELRTLALEGLHWMLTPPRTLTLVHAIQQPLLDPEFQNLQAAKGIGQTFATLTDEFPISGKSTIKIDIHATWTDPVDNLLDVPQPFILNGAVRAFEVPINPNETVAVIDDNQQTSKHFSSKHEFHDTKHRNVTYTAVATTRFMEYFPDALRSDPSNFTRTSQPVTISVLNSARPDAPKPLYVIPSFAWKVTAEGAWTTSKRSGGGLRVYLDRPWFSSGEGELLAVVLWGCSPPPGSTTTGWQMPDALKGFVTQWGKDPIWSAAAPPTQSVPSPEHFLNAVAVGTELTLDELSSDPFVSFTAVGHTVSYDDSHGRRLWYCDIEMEMGEAYFPFVRLALARYQPQSVPNAHLSRVVLVDFAQLMPDRSASITFDPIDTTSVQLAVNGLTYIGAMPAVVVATLQTQPVGGGDLAWVPVEEITLVAHTFGGPNTLWTAQFTLPAPRGSRPFRILIEEFESFTQDAPDSEQRRLVYADVLNL